MAFPILEGVAQLAPTEQPQAVAAGILHLAVDPRPNA